jgi:rhodanese-related sulfurtransferase
LTEINAHKDKRVIVVCKTDKRSASAATMLSAGGFRDVRVLRGGMEQWIRDGLAVVCQNLQTNSNAVG